MSAFAPMAQYPSQHVSAGFLNSSSRGERILLFLSPNLTLTSLHFFSFFFFFFFFFFGLCVLGRLPEVGLNLVCFSLLHLCPDVYSFYLGAFFVAESFIT